MYHLSSCGVIPQNPQNIWNPQKHDKRKLQDAVTWHFQTFHPQIQGKNQSTRLSFQLCIVIFLTLNIQISIKLLHKLKVIKLNLTHTASRSFPLPLKTTILWWLTSERNKRSPHSSTEMQPRQTGQKKKVKLLAPCVSKKSYRYKEDKMVKLSKLPEQTLLPPRNSRILPNLMRCLTLRVIPVFMLYLSPESVYLIPVLEPN